MGLVNTPWDPQKAGNGNLEEQKLKRTRFETYFGIDITRITENTKIYYDRSFWEGTYSTSYRLNISNMG